MVVAVEAIAIVVLWRMLRTRERALVAVHRMWEQRMAYPRPIDYEPPFPEGEKR